MKLHLNPKPQKISCNVTLNDDDLISLFLKWEDELQIVMPLLGALDLFQYSMTILKQAGCFRECDAAPLLRDMLAAVAWLHSRDIIHRDIKPANLVVTSTGGLEQGEGAHLVLIDFGLATHCSDSDRLWDEEGTLQFMPPEMVAKKGYGKGMDNWACGVIAFSLLQGCMPFTTEAKTRVAKRKEMIHNIRDEEPAWSYPLSPSARSFLEGLLAKDPSQRLTARAALGSEWVTQTPEYPIADQVVSGWRRIHNTHKLAEAATKLLAAHLPNVEVMRMRKAFYELDRGNQNYLTYEVCQGARSFCFPKCNSPPSPRN